MTKTPLIHSKMRRLILTLAATVFVLSIIIGVGSATASADTPVEVELNGPEQIAPGETATLNVTTTAADRTPVYGTQFTLSSSTTVTGRVDSGGFLAQNASSVVISRDVSGTTINFGETRTGSDTGVTGQGTLAVVHLTVPSSVEADELDLTFSDVKVANANAEAVETTTTGATLDIAGEAETGDDGNTGTESGSDVESDENVSETTASANGTATTSFQSSATEWPSTVPADVVERYDDTDRLPVIFTLNADTSPTSVADRLQQHGADNVTVLNQIDSVSANVTSSTLRSVARDDAVNAIRYDSSQQNAAESTGDSTTESMSSSSAATNTSTESTSSIKLPTPSNPLVPLTALAVAVCSLLLRQRAEI